MLTVHEKQAIYLPALLKQGENGNLIPWLRTCGSHISVEERWNLWRKLRGSQDFFKISWSEQARLIGLSYQWFPNSPASGVYRQKMLWSLAEFWKRVALNLQGQVKDNALICLRAEMSDRLLFGVMGTETEVGQSLSLARMFNWEGNEPVHWANLLLQGHWGQLNHWLNYLQHDRALQFVNFRAPVVKGFEDGFVLLALPMARIKSKKIITDMWDWFLNEAWNYEEYFTPKSWGALLLSAFQDQNLPAMLKIAHYAEKGIELDYGLALKISMYWNDEMISKFLHKRILNIVMSDSDLHDLAFRPEELLSGKSQNQNYLNLLGCGLLSSPKNVASIFSGMEMLSDKNSYQASAWLKHILLRNQAWHAEKKRPVMASSEIVVSKRI